MTLLECLNIAASELKEGRTVKFRMRSWLIDADCLTLDGDGNLMCDDERYHHEYSLTTNEWEIIKEPDYPGFAKAVLGTPPIELSDRDVVMKFAKQFNIPMEEK